MTDLLEKLWPAFVSEVTEQLDSVELLLAKSGSIDVNHLFRNFHTIKGNCSMIGFTSMETLAHRSEDVLALVRNGDMAMDDDVIDILLRAIDRLKKQFTEAHDSRENAPQDNELVAALENFASSKLGQPEEAESEVSDEEMRANLEALVTAAKIAVPSLVLGMDAAAKAEQVEKPVKLLAEKAKTSKFKALARSLAHYLAVLKTDFNDKKQLLAITAEIFDDITFICAEHDVDLALELGAKLSRSKLASPYGDKLGELTAVVEELKETDIQNWQAEQFLSIVSLTDSLGHFCSMFMYPSLHASWRYIKQLVIELSRGYISFNHAMIEVIGEISRNAVNGELDELASAEIKEILTKLQQVTAKHNNASDEILAIKEDIAAKSSLCVDSLVDLKIDVLTHISEQIDSGLLAIEVDIDFRNEELGEKVLTTVRNLGEMVHSRTMFHDLVNGIAQRTSFSICILSSKPLEDIQQILSIIDRKSEAHVILGFGDDADSTETESETHEAAVSEKLVPESEASSEEDDDSQTENLVNETSRSMGSLKVEGHAIDELISHVGELITHQNRLAHVINQDDFLQQIQNLKLLNEALKNETLAETLHYFNSLQSELIDVSEGLQGSINRVQASVLDLRVVPIAYVFDRFHKFVRTISQKLGKKVVLDVVGEHVKVDKGMIDLLSEPLAHMVRNSIDHGIESVEDRKAANKEELGLIKLEAEQRSGMVLIDIIDDGAGLDRDKILQKCIAKGMLKGGVEYTDQEIFLNIFEAGFSTSDIVSDTSGRGVGMDVVKNKILDVGGTVSVDSKKGEGTHITLKLPISAAIQSVILLENQKQTLAIPERFVTEVLSVPAEEIQLIKGQSVMMLRDNIIPLFRLDALLASQSCIIDKADQHEFEVVVLANEKNMAGLVVDATLGRTEVLVREAHETLKYMAAVSGATILGDGSVVIILDCEALFQFALRCTQNLLQVKN